MVARVHLTRQVEKLHNNKSPAAEMQAGLLRKALVGRCPALAGPPGFYPIWMGPERGALEVGVDREAGAKRFDFGFDFCFDVGVAVGPIGGQPVDDFDDPVSDLAEFILSKPAGGCSGRAQTDAGGDHGLFRVKRYAVFVAGDMRTTQCFFGVVAFDAFGAQVDQ